MTLIDQVYIGRDHNHVNAAIFDKNGGHSLLDGSGPRLPEEQQFSLLLNLKHIEDVTPPSLCDEIFLSR